MATSQAQQKNRFRWQSSALIVVLLASFGLYLALGSGLDWLAALMFALLALAYGATVAAG